MHGHLCTPPLFSPSSLQPQNPIYVLCLLCLIRAQFYSHLFSKTLFLGSSQVHAHLRSSGGSAQHQAAGKRRAAGETGGGGVPARLQAARQGMRAYMKRFVEFPDCMCGGCCFM